MAFLRAFSFLFVFFSVSSVIDDERSSLLSFKASLENPTALSSWNRSSSSPCNWVGVTCCFGKVKSLSLPSISLKGKLPPLLFPLRFLTDVDLSKNSLFGEIPIEITNLKNLKSLRPNLNSLSGVIPLQLGKLKELQTLDLSGNSLTGLPPRRLGELPQLLYLDLSDNHLSGSLPTSFFLSFPVLSSLDVSNNSLFAEIPLKIKSETKRILDPSTKMISRLAIKVWMRFSGGCE